MRGMWDTVDRHVDVRGLAFQNCESSHAVAWALLNDLGRPLSALVFWVFYFPSFGFHIETALIAVSPCSRFRLKVFKDVGVPLHSVASQHVSVPRWGGPLEAAYCCVFFASRSS